MSKTEKGLIMVYTGNGKGKTTAALGQALRAAGHGFRVLVINFMKGRDYGEVKAAEFLPNLKIVKAGRDKFVNRENPDPEDLRLAEKGFALAKEAVKSGRYDLVILDEINQVVSYNLIPLQEVLDLLDYSRNPDVHVILTGRDAPPEFLERADLVSEVREIKHHYTSGIKAQKGIEY